jgi:DNA-binding CsgD family transcriptional regulator
MSNKSCLEGNLTMNFSISTSGLTQGAAPTESLADAQPSQSVQHPAATAGDSVKLSQAAQIHLLKQQGQSPSQIAANLGVSAATVDGYLGIAVPKAPAAPVAATPSAPSPDPVAEQAAQPAPVSGK